MRKTYTMRRQQGKPVGAVSLFVYACKVLLPLASSPCGLFARFGVFVAGDVGALPQTPQGARPLTRCAAAGGVCVCMQSAIAARFIALRAVRSLWGVIRRGRRWGSNPTGVSPLHPDMATGPSPNYFDSLCQTPPFQLGMAAFGCMFTLRLDTKAPNCLCSLRPLPLPRES